MIKHERERKRPTWFDYIAEVLARYLEPVHRSVVFKEVRELAKKDERNIPDTFEDTIQQAYERNCVDSEIFRGRPLFAWPKGKGSGYWMLNRPAGEVYWSKRNPIIRMHRKRNEILKDLDIEINI